jgi:hypothetical protein
MQTAASFESPNRFINDPRDCRTLLEHSLDSSTLLLNKQLHEFL